MIPTAMIGIMLFQLKFVSIKIKKILYKKKLKKIFFIITQRDA